MILTGDNVKKSEEYVDKLQTQLNTNPVDDIIVENVNKTRRRLLLPDNGAFREWTESCMQSEDKLKYSSDDILNATDNAEIEEILNRCKPFIGLDLDSFQSLVILHLYYTDIIRFVSYTVNSLLAAKVVIPEPDPPKSLVAKYIVLALRWTIYVFMMLCLIAAILGRMHAKKMKADNVKPCGIFWFSLYTWDFYSDILFVVRLAEYSVNKEEHADIVWYLFAASAVFIVVPWLLNLLQLFRAQKKWTTDSAVQEGVRGWFVGT